MKKLLPLLFLFALTACSRHNLPQIKTTPVMNNPDKALNDTLVARRLGIHNNLRNEAIMNNSGVIGATPVKGAGERITAVTSPTPVSLPLYYWNDSAQIWSKGLNPNYVNRMNIVMLGDGYTGSKYDSVKKFKDANALIASLKIRVPLSLYFNRFAFYFIAPASHDSGIGELKTNDGCTLPITVNNYFGSFMGFEGICRFSNYNATVVNNVLAGTMPYYDIPVVLVNTQQYAGGADGAVAQTTANSLSTEIFIHELGHALGGLGDEYSYGGCGYSPEWNAVATNDTAFARHYWGDTWVAWLPGDGKFTGADYCPQGLRDSVTCEMNVLGSPFCPQCKKRFIYSFNYYTSNIDGFTPALNATSATTLSIKVLQPRDKTVKITWYLNGVAKYKNVTSINPPSGLYSTISVTTIDTSKWLFTTAPLSYSETWNNITIASATPPPPPASPAGVSTISGITIPVSCTAVIGATSYVFKLNTGQSVSSSAPNAVFAGLANKTTYILNVYAVNANGTSAPSSPITFTTP